MNSSLKYGKQRNKKPLITSLLAFCLMMMVSSFGFAALPGLSPAIDPGLKFSPTPVNSEVTKVIKVENVEVFSTLEVTLTNLVNGDLDNFTLDDSDCLNVVLNFLESCFLEVKFLPTAAQSYDVELNIIGLENGFDFFIDNYPITGNGLAIVEVTSDPNVLEFGNAIVGTQTPPKLVLVQNTGATEVEITSVNIEGNDAAEYSIVENTCFTTLKPGAACFLQVAFNPQNEGLLDQAFIDFISSPNANIAGVLLSGTGVAGGGILFIAPDPVNFGNIGVGFTSPPQNISVTNIGDGTVNIGQVSDDNGFQNYEKIFDNCSNIALNPGLSCTITYTYTATGDIVDDIATVFIPNDAGDEIVILNASGVLDPAVSFSPLLVNFGPVAVGDSSDSSIITVTSVGATPLEVDNVQLINGTHFTLVQDNCVAKVLNPGASCLIVVKASPQAAGNFGDSIKFTTNAGIEPSVPLAVEGVLRELTIAPGAPFDFGAVNSGETSADQVFTVTNTGGAPINIFGASLIGSDVENFNVIAEDCSGKVLAVAGECNITVNYQPNAAGSHVAQIQVAANTSESPVSHEIRGTGIGIGGAVLELDPAALDFDRLNVGQIQSQQITVTNIGNEAAAVDAVSIAGNTPEAFSQENSCTGLTLASGESCVIVVTFNSNVEGNFNAVVVVESANADNVEAQLFGSTLLVDLEGGCSLNTQAQSSLGLGFALLLTLGLARRLRKN